jgi:cyclopropane fatty-acyl-phospholipid synthase-like methyltransferase
VTGRRSSRTSPRSDDFAPSLQHQAISKPLIILVLDAQNPAASFDAVVSIQVLEYVDNVPAALAEMHRVLKPGGRVANFATIWATLY